MMDPTKCLTEILEEFRTMGAGSRGTAITKLGELSRWIDYGGDFPDVNLAIAQYLPASYFADKSSS